MFKVTKYHRIFLNYFNDAENKITITSNAHSLVHFHARLNTKHYEIVVTLNDSLKSFFRIQNAKCVHNEIRIYYNIRHKSAIIASEQANQQGDKFI